jgi:hypothetical protein
MSSEHRTGTRIAELTSRLAALDRERPEIIVDLLWWAAVLGLCVRPNGWHVRLPIAYQCYERAG